MKKILITGGAGFIGSHTAVELFVAGYEPVIVDDFSNSERWIVDRIEQISGKRPKVYEGDCADKEFLADVFAKEKIEGVIHFAAFKAVGESVLSPLSYYKNNLNSTIAVLECMKEFGVKNIVFSSSATVYGDPDANPIPEIAPRKPATNPYGNTKSINEDILRDCVTAGEKFSVVSLRYFNPIGAHSSGLIGELPKGTPNNLVPFLTQAAAGKRDKLTVFGDDYDTPDGTCIRDFIHVVDLAGAHVKTLQYLEKQTAPFYDVFNVGTGRGVSVKELVDIFEKVNNVSVPYEIGNRRNGDLPAFFSDASKIKKVIGWQAEKSTEDALKDAWKWEQMI